MGSESNFGIDFGNHVDELVEVDDSVSVLIGVLDHLIDLSGGEVLADRGSDLLELLRAEGSGAGCVEGLEDSLESGLARGVSAEAEDVEEGAEVELSGDSRGVDDGEDLSGLLLEVEGLNGVDEFFD